MKSKPKVAKPTDCTKVSKPQKLPFIQALCIDASPGEANGNLPPFKEGEIVHVRQSIKEPDWYDVGEDPDHYWGKFRFILLSTFSEVKILKQRKPNNRKSDLRPGSPAIDRTLVKELSGFISNRLN